MKMTRFVAFVSILVIAGAASAEYEFHNVSESSASVSSASVACSYEGTIVVAWSLEWVGVYTRTYHEDMIEAPVFHGPGTMATVSWSSWGFTLAYANGPELITRRGDGLDWHDMETFSTASGENVLSPRLTGNLGEPDHPHTYLAWEEDGEAIWFSGRWGNSWTEPVEIAAPAGGGWGGAMPQAQRVGNGETRIYQMSEANNSLRYHQGWFDGGSFPPQDIFPGLGYFGSMFDTDEGPWLTSRALSMGPQPTCPCNVIRYTEEYPPGVWSEPVDLTVEQDHYNFAQFPCIESDSEDEIHAFWFQSFSNEMLEPTGEGLFYFTRGTDGIWHDRSDLFGSRSGIWCAMDMDSRDNPVFVYAPGEYPDRFVWLAYDPIVTSADPVPTARPALNAAPNPFNPKTTLRYDLRAAGRVELAVYDLKGRRVATLLDELREAGTVTVDWNGRDEAGRRLGSGLYLARATAGGSSVSEKLLMLK